MTMHRPKSGLHADGATTTDLDRTVDAIRAAAELAHTPPSRRPWVEPLPPIIRFGSPNMAEDVPEEPGIHRAALGVADLPDAQTQEPYVWNLAQTQNLLIVGDGGTGKTTALRTIAVSFASKYTADDALILAVDAAGGGLGSIDGLPNTVACIDGSNSASVRRGLAYLRRIVIERRAIVGKAGSLWTYRQHSGEHVPDVIVLVDGFDHLMANLEVLDGGGYHSGFVQLLSDGPAMGVHFALATDQPHRVPMSVGNAIPERVVLRMASRDASHAAEVKADVSGLPNGRAVSSRTRDEAQLAVVASDEATDGLEQQARITQIAQVLGASGRRMCARLAEPPEVLTPTLLSAVGTLPTGQVPIGVDDLYGLAVVVDFNLIPTLLVVGPDLSGRTSVLEWIRRCLAERAPAAVRSVYFGGRGQLPDGGGWSDAFTDLREATELLEEFAAARVDVRADSLDLFIAIDDGDEVIDSSPIGARPEETQLLKRFNTAMEALLRTGRNGGAVVVLAGRLNALSRSAGWPQRMRQNQQALLLAPPLSGSIVTDPVFNVTLPRRTDFIPRAGTGVLLRRGAVEVVQTVYPVADDSI